MAALIFDFDGTIADSFGVVVDILHDLTGRKERLPDDEIERLRGMNLVDAAKDMHVPVWKMPFMIIQIRRRQTQKMGEIHAHPGITEVIRKLQAEGHQLFIMSTNSGSNIDGFLKRHKLDHDFVRIYSGVGLFSKARTLRKILKHNSLEPKDVWYIGDEDRDVKAAHEAGLRIIAVTWGYSNATILDHHRPTRLVHQPADIITAIL